MPETCDDLWVTKIANADRALQPHGRFLTQRLHLWSGFLAECQKCVQAFNQAYGCGACLEDSRNRAKLTVKDPPFETNGDLAELTSDGGCIEAKILSRNATERLTFVFDDDSAVRLEHAGRLVSIQEAARIVMAPALFGISVHVPPRER